MATVTLKDPCTWSSVRVRKVETERYGEVNQTPPDEAAIAALPEIELMGQLAKFLELDGEFRGMGGPPIPDARLLVAVRSEGNGVVFAKCVGPKDEVAAQKDAFVAYCKTLRRAQ